MEKKLNEMELREKTFIHDTEATIVKHIDDKLESKLNTVSKLVASHVTSQLMDAMQQYMHKSMNRLSPQLQATELPMLTQDVPSPMDKHTTEDTQLSSDLVTRIKHTNMYDMKKALSDIENTSHKSRPPHDTSLGRRQSSDE